MKIFGFIFAFYVLFLAIQPGLKNITSLTSQKTETCCGRSCEPIEKKQPEKSSEKKDKTDKAACNPFQTCNSCISFSDEFVCLNFSPVIVFSKSYTENKEKVPPQITLDFWQPPKIA